MHDRESDGERDRERERECVCVCVCTIERGRGGGRRRGGGGEGEKRRAQPLPQQYAVVCGLDVTWTSKRGLPVHWRASREPVRWQASGKGPSLPSPVALACQSGSPPAPLRRDGPVWLLCWRGRERGTRGEGPGRLDQWRFEGGGGLAQGLGIRLFAFGGAYWPLATAHSDPLWVRKCFGCVNGAPRCGGGILSDAIWDQTGRRPRLSHHTALHYTTQYATQQAKACPSAKPTSVVGGCQGRQTKPEAPPPPREAGDPRRTYPWDVRITNRDFSSTLATLATSPSCISACRTLPCQQRGAGATRP